MDISWLLEDLLYKDIPLTLYVKTKNVMDKESTFIAWDHNGTNVKYLPCVFKGVYVLDVSNLLEDLLYDDTPTKFHVYDTQDYFDTIWHLLIFNWIHKLKKEQTSFPLEDMFRNYWKYHFDSVL